MSSLDLETFNFWAQDLNCALTNTILVGVGYGSPIANGGLGVRKISASNQDLLGKMALALWVGRHPFMGMGNCYEELGEMGREDFIIGLRETWM